MVNGEQCHGDIDMNIQVSRLREQKSKYCNDFSTTTSFISPYAFVKHDYKTKQQESRSYVVWP